MAAERALVDCISRLTNSLWNSSLDIGMRASLDVSSTRVSISLQTSSPASICGEEVLPRILLSIAAYPFILTVLTRNFAHVDAVAGE